MDSLNNLIPWVATNLWQPALSWVTANLPQIVLGVIGALIVYTIAGFRYWHLSNKAGENILLGPIAISGGIPDILGPRGCGLILRAKLQEIAEDFNQASVENDNQQEDHALDFPIVNSLLEYAPLEINRLRLSAQRKLEVSEEATVTIGPVELPLGALWTMVKTIFRRQPIPVPYRRRFLSSLVHLRLVSTDEETMVIVSRQGQPSAANPAEAGEETPGSADGRMELIQMASTKTFDEFSDVLRDAVFMILKIRFNFGGRTWRSSRYFYDGFRALNDYRKNWDIPSREKAKECFGRAVESDPDNSVAQYFYASMLLNERRQDSILSAQGLFNHALKIVDSKNGPNLDQKERHKLRALIKAGLANCYLQEYHRLAIRPPEILANAGGLAEEALEIWKQATDGRETQPWILGTLATINIVGEEENISTEAFKKRYLDSAQKLCQAIKLEPNNGTFHNNLGWLLLRLAQKCGKISREEERIFEDCPDARTLSEKAEYYLLRAKDINSSNKLTRANLCLLYALPFYRTNDKDRKNYHRCRFHGLMAVRLDPTYINGYRDLAFSLLRYGNYGEAIRHFQKALELTTTIDKDEELIGDARKVIEEIREEKIEIPEEVSSQWLHPDDHFFDPPGSEKPEGLPAEPKKPEEEEKQEAPKAG